MINYQVSFLTSLDKRQTSIMKQVKPALSKKLTQSTLRYFLTLLLMMGTLLLYLNADFRMGMPTIPHYYGYSAGLSILSLTALTGLILLSAYFHKTKIHLKERLFLSALLFISFTFLIGYLYFTSEAFPKATKINTTYISDYFFWGLLYYLLAVSLFLNLNVYRKAYWGLSVIIFPPISLALTFVSLILLSSLFTDASRAGFLSFWDSLLYTKLTFIPLQSPYQATELTEEGLALYFSITSLVTIFLVKLGFAIYLRLKHPLVHSLVKYGAFAGSLLLSGLYLFFNFS